MSRTPKITCKKKQHLKIIISRDPRSRGLSVQKFALKKKKKKKKRFQRFEKNKLKKADLGFRRHDTGWGPTSTQVPIRNQWRSIQKQFVILLNSKFKAWLINRKKHIVGVNDSFKAVWTCGLAICTIFLWQKKKKNNCSPSFDEQFLPWAQFLPR